QVLPTSDPQTELTVEPGGLVVRLTDPNNGQVWDLGGHGYHLGTADRPGGLWIDVPGRGPVVLRHDATGAITAQRFPEAAPSRPLRPGGWGGGRARATPGSGRKPPPPPWPWRDRATRHGRRRGWSVYWASRASATTARRSSPPSARTGAGSRWRPATTCCCSTPGACCGGGWGTACGPTRWPSPPPGPRWPRPPATARGAPRAWRRGGARAPSPGRPGPASPG